MLSRVEIQNFKSIGEPGVDLELKPLTFLVGPNGGGKSNVLDAIVFASQRGASTPSFVFPDADELRFRHDADRIHLRVEVAIGAELQRGNFELSITRAEGIKELFSRRRPRPYSDIEDQSQTPPTGRNIMDRGFFKKVYPLRATRGNLENRRVSSPEAWVGRNGENTVQLLSQIAHAKYIPKRDRIAKWANQFAMRDVAASILEQEYLEASYVDDKLDTPLNASFASTGSRQVLPLIVQLFWSDPDSIILIEEPEISLHPELQIRLLEMFAEAISERKQIILTTHSHFLLQAIGYAVHNKWMKADQISVYHVVKGENGTEVESLALGKNGYIQGWIPSFNEVERRLLREWAETLPRE